MSNRTASLRRERRGQRQSLFFPALLILPGCAAVAFAAWSASSSPALASILSLSSAATPTHFQSWAQAEIAKPTYTPWPTSLPSQTPTHPPEVLAAISIDPTSAPEVIYAEIVPDTPVAEYSPYSADPSTSSAQASQEPAAPISGGNKYILVDISDQHLYAYEGDLLVYSFVASTGMNNATAVGSFSVLSKIPNAYGATWNIWMPNWLGIYWAGGLQNGIHALPILPNGAQLWAGYLGTPISYGCVVLGAYESQLLYDWAEIGTPVEIQW